MDKNKGKITGYDPRELSQIERILSTVSDWFNETGAREAIARLNPKHTLLYSENDRVLGFLTWSKHRKPGYYEILDMAVDSSVHRAGIGAALMEELECLLPPGCTVVVKTLDASVEDEFYLKTRSFYEACGFMHARTFKHPAWDEENVCGEYRKELDFPMSGLPIDKVGAVVLRNRGEWEIALGLFRGEYYFLPKGHLDGNYPVAQSREECIEEIDLYPLTCQGLLHTYRYNYLYTHCGGEPVDVAITLEFYLYTSSTPVMGESVEFFDHNTTCVWVPLKNARRYLIGEGSPWQWRMNLEIIQKLLRLTDTKEEL